MRVPPTTTAPAACCNLRLTCMIETNLSPHKGGTFSTGSRNRAQIHTWSMANCACDRYFLAIRRLCGIWRDYGYATDEGSTLVCARKLFRAVTSACIAYRDRNATATEVATFFSGCCSWLTSNKFITREVDWCVVTCEPISLIHELKLPTPTDDEKAKNANIIMMTLCVLLGHEDVGLPGVGLSSKTLSSAASVGVLRTASFVYSIFFVRPLVAQRCVYHVRSRADKFGEEDCRN